MSDGIEVIFQRCKIQNWLKVAGGFCLLLSSALAYRVTYQDFNAAPSLIPLGFLILAATLFLATFVIERKE